MQEYLISMGYEAGAQLPTEGQFASELQVSRNAVREALRGLEALGIVDIRHGSGTYLRDSDSIGLTTTLTFWSRLRGDDELETLRLIAEVRDGMESSLATKVIGRHTAAQLVELESMVTQMANRAADGQPSPEIDRKFHRLLFEPLHNWVLDHVLDSFWDTYLRVGSTLTPPPDLGLIATQHRAIVDALRAVDGDALAAAMSHHFDNAFRQ